MLKLIKIGGAGGVTKASRFGNCDTEAVIDVCYHAILGRSPDRVGLSNYGKMIAESSNPETLIASVRSIAMSEEARNYHDHHLAMKR